MSLAKTSRYLLDVNILVALAFRGHLHHRLVRTWFNVSPIVQWTMCAFTEAGFLRYATTPRLGELDIAAATTLLTQFSKHPGYSYLPIGSDWHTLCGRFMKRLYGNKQVTDAYLLGLAVREGMVLVTMDKGIVHLAGEEHGGHVLLLGAERDEPTGREGKVGGGT